MIPKATGSGPGYEVHNTVTPDTEINMEKAIDTRTKPLEFKKPGPNTPGIQVLF